MDAPSRAFRMTLVIDADSRDELAWALRRLSDAVDRDEISTGVSGGPDSGWIYELLHDPSMTHEVYFEAVRTYLAAKARPEETREG